MCEEPQNEQQWYAIRVTYSREMAAKSYLDSIGIESYVPMHFAERTYGGKRRKIWGTADPQPAVRPDVGRPAAGDKSDHHPADPLHHGPRKQIADGDSGRQMQDFMAVVATQNEHVEIVAPQDVDLEKEIRYASRRACSGESKAATSATKGTQHKGRRGDPQRRQPP